MIKIIILLLNIFFVNVSLGQSNNSLFDNSIEVGKPSIKKIRIAIPNFICAIKNCPIDATTLNRLTINLNKILAFTNWFDFINPQAFVKNKNFASLAFSSTDWKIIDTEFVILAKVTNATYNNFTLELKLYNVQSSEMILGKIYSNINIQLADVAMRKFADELIKVLTGKPGPFMSKIAFVGKKFRSERYGQIYIANFDGSNAVAITNFNAIHMSPAWSPDGSKLTYTGFDSGKPQIYQYNLLTRQTRQLSTGPSNVSGSTWSPDGLHIAFSGTTSAGATHIFLINYLGQNKTELINNSEIAVEAAFSHDGKFLAFTSNKYSRPMIFIRNLINSNEIRLTYAGLYNASANWSPDDKNIIFASYDKQIDRWDLFKINSDGTNLERLTLAQGDNEKPSWSPDGRFIMFQSTRGINGSDIINSNHKLYVMSKDGDLQNQIKTEFYDIQQISWGPRLDRDYYATK